MTNREEVIKTAQELQDYCKHRHEIKPKGHTGIGESLACYGCPFSYHYIPHDSWECGISYPYVWDVPGRNNTIGGKAE